jgi:predicted alpha/beta hydrolase family esterase
MKVILMHGKDATPENKWYPWFRDSMKDVGCDFIAPALPHADDPVMDEWLHELDNCASDEDTVLVGHSRGGVAIMRYLEKMSVDTKVKAVVLIATNSGALGDRSIPTESNYGFYTAEGYDFEQIKSHCDTFFVMHSKDDKTVPYESGVKNSVGLGVELMTFTDRRHFGTGIDTIPELLEIIEGLK